MTIRSGILTAVVLLTLAMPAQADAGASCEQLPTPLEVDDCVYNNLQASGSKLTAEIARLREEAKAMDAEAEPSQKTAEKLQQANLAFNTYLQNMCNYIASRHSDEATATRAYSRCNQKMIDQRLDLIATETAQ